MTLPTSPPPSAHLRCPSPPAVLNRPPGLNIRSSLTTWCPRYIAAICALPMLATTVLGLLRPWQYTWRDQVTFTIAHANIPLLWLGSILGSLSIKIESIDKVMYSLSTLMSFAACFTYQPTQRPNFYKIGLLSSFVFGTLASVARAYKLFTLGHALCRQRPIAPLPNDDTTTTTMSTPGKRIEKWNEHINSILELCFIGFYALSVVTFYDYFTSSTSSEWNTEATIGNVLWNLFDLTVLLPSLRFKVIAKCASFFFKFEAPYNRMVEHVASGKPATGPRV